MICVVDYGVGNIQAFLNLFKRLGIKAIRGNTPKALSQGKRFILPGVGHFDHAMQKLNDSGLRSKLEYLVLENCIPIMGVCVGMQMLGKKSEEGKLTGLNWIPGEVRAFANQSVCKNLPMPHMGWNQLQICTVSKLFSRGFQDSPEFYFLHSYFFETEDKRDVVATSHYGFDFDVVISHKHIHGMQCHPEKSHSFGEQFLRNFAEY